MKYTLDKSTKLKGKKSIQELFVSGKSVRKGPLRVVYNQVDKTGGIQAGFTVSKRYFKKAPDRNRVKRLMREAYRHHQHDLNIPTTSTLKIMIMYQSPKMPDYELMVKLIKSSIKDLNKKL